VFWLSRSLLIVLSARGPGRVDGRENKRVVACEAVYKTSGNYCKKRGGLQSKRDDLDLKRDVVGTRGWSNAGQEELLLFIS
jgi:hypothetical protein